MYRVGKKHGYLGTMLTGVKYLPGFILVGVKGHLGLAEQALFAGLQAVAIDATGDRKAGKPIKGVGVVLSAIKPTG